MKNISVFTSFVIFSIISLIALVSLPKQNISGIFSLEPQKIFKKVSYSDLSPEQKQEIDCLTKNIYYEAGFEPFEGWLAVANVTFNRVKSKHFPKTICEVVYQKTGKVYQFSWVKFKNKLTKINPTVYNEVLEFSLSYYFNQDFFDDVTHGSLFFHADYVNPKWKNVEWSTQIGKHIFYRSKLNS